MSVEDEKKGRPKTRGTYMTEIEEDLDILRDAMKDKAKSSKKYHQIVKTEYQNIKLEESIPYDNSATDPPRRKHPRRGRHKADPFSPRKRKDKGTGTNINISNNKSKTGTETSPKLIMEPLNVYRLYNASDCFQIGDIVSVLGNNNKSYFCQIRGFLRDQFCKSHVSIRWLLPVKTDRTYGPWPGFHGGSLKNFNPMKYTEGPEQEEAISVELITFIMHPPRSLFASVKNHLVFDPSDKGWDAPTPTINNAKRRF